MRKLIKPVKILAVRVVSDLKLRLRLEFLNLTKHSCLTSMLGQVNKLSVSLFNLVE